MCLSSNKKQINMNTKLQKKASNNICVSKNNYKEIETIII